jgi:predicted protein tyrosine phosphatase
MSIQAPQDPDSYWVEPGRFLAGEYPGHVDEARARMKVQALIEAGIRVFIDLTEPGEYGLRPYERIIDEARRTGRDLTYRRLPIRDISVPTAARMREILSLVDESLEAGRPVYVHCWGGTGRTGTVVGCWLVERERADGDPVEALRPLRGDCKKAHRRSPDTDEQEEFVRSWTRPEGSEA